MIVHDPEGRWVEGEGLDWAALPERVEGVIAARVERLPDELRDLLAVASVEGEEFTAEVVARVRDADTREVVRLLSRELETRHRLVRAHGVRALAAGRLSRFGFSHVLFQRYLYGTLNEVERVQLHEDVGTALEALYGDDTEEIAVQLAHHFEQAGIIDKAIRYLQQAGQSCVHRTANREAIGHFQRALELLATLTGVGRARPHRARPADGDPDPADRRCSAGGTHGLERPWSGPTIWWSGSATRTSWCRCCSSSRIFERAQPEHPRRNRPWGARARARRGARGRAEIILAHWLLGVVCAFAGDLARGRAHFEEAVSLYDATPAPRPGAPHRVGPGRRLAGAPHLADTPHGATSTRVCATRPRR